MKPSKKAVKLAPQVNKALKALGWGGWKPEVGDWYLYVPRGDLWVVQKGWVPVKQPDIRRIFIPHWEQIEEIMMELGYKLAVLSLKYDVDTRLTTDWHCLIGRQGGGKSLVGTLSPTRQEAVMQAVIALAKKVKK